VKGKGKVVPVLNQAPRHEGVLGRGMDRMHVAWDRP